MPHVSFVAMSSAIAESYWKGAPDAYSQLPERHISDGDGAPCRHCLSDVAAGEAYLILAYCPFPTHQPFAETGPIFLHAGPCRRYDEAAGLPPMFLERPCYLLRGYDADDRIVYGTGRIEKPNQIIPAAQEIFARDEVAYIHLRSGLNNCFQCRIDRA